MSKTGSLCYHDQQKYNFENVHVHINLTKIYMEVTESAITNYIFNQLPCPYVVYDYFNYSEIQNKLYHIPLFSFLYFIGPIYINLTLAYMKRKMA